MLDTTAESRRHAHTINLFHLESHNKASVSRLNGKGYRKEGGQYEDLYWQKDAVGRALLGL